MLIPNKSSIIYYVRAYTNDISSQDLQEEILLRKQNVDLAIQNGLELLKQTTGESFQKITIHWAFFLVLESAYEKSEVKLVNISPYLLLKAVAVVYFNKGLRSRQVTFWTKCV